MDSKAHEGIVRACREREAAAKRSRLTGRATLVPRIRRRLGLTLTPGLHPETTDQSHSEKHDRNNHSAS
jgi:hypothetical protein